MYNVTVYALNFVTEVETWDELTIIVTSAPCAPPEVTIPLNSTLGTSPLAHKMSSSIAISTLAKVNCSDLKTTKKVWDIAKALVNASNLYEELTVLDMSQIAPNSMDKSELIIPPRALGYGTYKLTFYSRMWDERPEDPLWTRKLPFERSAFTYIEIIPSDLVVKMIDATADLVTRGRGQTLTLEPYLYSSDPDFPNDKDKGFEYQWFCRMMDDSQNGEDWPLDDNDQMVYNVSDLLTVPRYETPPNIDGGCFGSGPGAINITEGIVTIDTVVFTETEQLYEILLKVRKETFSYKPGFIRTSIKKLHIMIVSGIPPVMMILCADPALCFTDSSGNTFINPSSRLALKAWCSLDEGSDCSEPFTYEWVIKLPGESDLLPITPEQSPTGLDNIEFAIMTEFFKEHQSENAFHIGLTAMNGNEATGATLLYININQVPKDGSCSVTPTYGVSMVDKFILTCDGWIDPENAGIKQYLITSESNGNVASLAKVTMFDPKEPLELTLSTGVHKLFVTIEDLWGGRVVFQLADPVEVDPIDPSSFSDFMKSGTIEELAETGDKGALLMVLQAQAEVLADSDAFVSEEPLVAVPGLELTPEEQERNEAVVKAQMKIDAFTMLDNTAAGVTTELSTTEIVAKTVESLIGDGPLEGESGDIGLEATKSATKILQNLADSLNGLENIPDPTLLIPSMTSMTGAIGVLLEGIMKTSNIETTEDSTADEICPHIVPIDEASADKPGVVDYDTDIGDNVDMKVPEDPQAQRCGGIIDAAKLTGASVGQKLMDILSQMGQTLLAKSVVNEEQLIETPGVTVYAKM